MKLISISLMGSGLILSWAGLFARRRYNRDYFHAVAICLYAIGLSLTSDIIYPYFLLGICLAFDVYQYRQHFKWYKDFERYAQKTFDEANIRFEDFVARGIVRSNLSDDYVVLVPNKKGDETHYQVIATGHTRGEAIDVQQILYTIFGRDHKMIVKPVSFYKECLKSTDENNKKDE